jgi:hypothetical protein
MRLPAIFSDDFLQVDRKLGEDAFPLHNAVAGMALPFAPFANLPDGTPHSPIEDALCNDADCPPSTHLLSDRSSLRSSVRSIFDGDAAGFSSVIGYVGASADESNSVGHDLGP